MPKILSDGFKGNPFIELHGGSFVTGEVTKKQRKIIEALELDLDRLLA